MSTFQAMNTSFLTAGLASENHAKVVDAVTDAELSYSRFIDGNILARINASNGEWVPVDDRTHRLLTDAVAIHNQTGGIFNPFQGQSIKDLGYDRSFETLASAHEKHDVKDSVTSSKCAETEEIFQVDPIASQVRWLRPAVLDLGGFAKGWIAQDIAEHLMINHVDNGLIDAGGDIVLWGRDLSQQFWGIGVANPREPENEVASLWFDGLTAIATSSVLKRRWSTETGFIHHHIIDPRTKLSAKSDLIQVTILSRDLAVSEAYAKALLILGSEAGSSWISKMRPDVAYIAMRNDGKLLTSSNLNCYCSKWEEYS